MRRIAGRTATRRATVWQRITSQGPSAQQWNVKVNVAEDSVDWRGASGGRSRKARSKRSECDCHKSHASAFGSLHTKGHPSVLHTGRLNQKVAPLSGLFSAQMRPPCASTILRLLARPMPMPCALVVKKVSKMVSSLSG